MADRTSHDLLLKHVHNSPYRGTVENATLVTHDISPSCGDTVTFYCIIDDAIVQKMRFVCEGSVLGQVTASLMCQHAQGESIESILEWNVMQILQWLDIELGPNRRRTVEFMLDVLQEGFRSYVQSGENV